MEIYSSPVMKIDYDEILKVLKQTWNGLASSIQFREVIDTTLAFSKTNDVRYIMIDTLALKPVAPEESKYAASLLPELFKTGVKAMAFIMPVNVITKLAVNFFISSFAKEKGVPNNVKSFDNEAEAESWLLKH